MAWMRRVLVIGGVAALLLTGRPVLAGGGGHGGQCFQATPALDDGWVAVADNCFSPTTVEIATGQAVRWQSDAGMPHTVTFTNNAVGSGSMNAGDSYGVQFNAPGTYEYSCLIHPGMNGRVEVTGDDVAGPALVEIDAHQPTGGLGSAEHLAAATTAANVTRPDTVTLGLDAGAGFTLILFGLAIGAGAGLVTRFRRPSFRDDLARS